jgi:hypothetical protein
MKDEFRCLIAALYGKTYANNKTVVLDTDVALRCAFYGNAELTSKEMHKGRERDGAASVFAVLFNDHVYRKPELRKLLEEEHLYGKFTARSLRRCEQLHKRWPNFDPRPMADWLAIEGATETEQSSMSKLTAWASASDRKMADLAKHIQSAKKWMAWGFIIGRTRYTAVNDYARISRTRSREVFVPLAHPPGHAQVDYTLPRFGASIRLACWGSNPDLLQRNGATVGIEPTSCLPLRAVATLSPSIMVSTASSRLSS